MVEMSRTELIQELIAKNAKRRDGLKAQLHKFETGEYRLGTTDVGVGGGDISQHRTQQLREWIAEADSLLTGLDDLSKGRRSSI